jgi:hypothetical protein
MTDKPSQPVDTTTHNSPVLSEFVRQHQMSTQRDRTDAANDRTYPAVDNKAVATISATAAVDSQILDLAKAGKPIPQELVNNAVRLHTASTTDARRDRSGDNDALGQDRDGIKAEQAAINSDNALLRSGHIDPSLRKALNADIAAKQGLIANDQRDFGNEGAYIKHDIADIATNDRVIKALKGNHADLIPALQASIASKGNTGHDRGEDARLEPGYASADDKDAKMNKMILDAVHNPEVWNRLYHGNNPGGQPHTGAQAPKKPA